MSDLAKLLDELVWAARSCESRRVAEERYIAARTAVENYVAKLEDEIIDKSNEYGVHDLDEVTRWGKWYGVTFNNGEYQPGDTVRVIRVSEEEQ